MQTTLSVRLGHTFNDPKLLQTALTHRSYYFENRDSSPGHFERFEFLGDSVLDLLLSESLMQAYPEVDEGTLSKWRASLVNESNLADVAAELNLGQDIFLGKSEANHRGSLRPRLLASTFEAVLAAIYLDGGILAARAFVDRCFTSQLQLLNTHNEYAADFKSRLQEWSQKSFRSVPEYRLVSSEGPEHAKFFTYEVFVNEKKLGVGSGNSRKSAEQEAARNALTEENIA